MGERRNAYRVLVGKPEGKRLLRRLMHRWEDNNKMDVKELGQQGMRRIHLTEDRGQGQALVYRVKCWKFLYLLTNQDFAPWRQLEEYVIFQIRIQQQWKLIQCPSIRSRILKFVKKNGFTSADYKKLYTAKFHQSNLHRTGHAELSNILDYRVVPILT